MSEPLFNKVAGVKAYNFIKKGHRTDVLLWILQNFAKQQLQTVATAKSQSVVFIVPFTK